MIEALDHVNVRTARLAEMVAWYDAMLGLSPGPRPDFSMGGAWLYAGPHAVVHLVEVAETPPPSDDLALEHAAFRARGLAGFVAKLKAAGAPFRASRVPGLPILQVNVWDPDGNHLHIDFDAGEAEGLDAEALTSPPR
jgi:catechol 2,3-dioxygenase-like lactoylglutathione lyase family enzyme